MLLSADVLHVKVVGTVFVFTVTIEFVGNKGKSDLLCYEDSK